jgi:hypothetical protein
VTQSRAKERGRAPLAGMHQLILMHHCPHAVWLLHEQVAIASLDSGAYSYAAPLIKAIANQFPKATRTTRLQVHA